MMNTIEHLANKIEILTIAIMDINNELGVGIPMFQTTGITEAMVSRLNSVDYDFAVSKLRKCGNPEIATIQLDKSYFLRLFLLNPDTREIDLTELARHQLFITDPGLMINSLKISSVNNSFTGGFGLEASLEFTADGLRTRLFNDDVYNVLTTALALESAEYYFSDVRYNLKHTPFKYLKQTYSELDAKAKASEVPVIAVVKDHNYTNRNKYFYNSTLGVRRDDAGLTSSEEPWIGLRSYYQIDVIYGLVESLKEALEKGELKCDSIEK